MNIDGQAGWRRPRGFISRAQAAWPLSGRPGCTAAPACPRRPRRLLCNQKRRSCCLDISIFISFIDFIFMAFGECFLWSLTSFCCPGPLTGLRERGGGVKTRRPLLQPRGPLFSPVPLPPRSLPQGHTLQVQGPGRAGAHPSPRSRAPSRAPGRNRSQQALTAAPEGPRVWGGGAGPITGEGRALRASFPSAASMDVGET